MIIIVNSRNKQSIINNHFYYTHQFHGSIVTLFPFSIYLSRILHCLGLTGVLEVFFISELKSEKSINPFSSFDNHLTYIRYNITFAVAWLGAD